MSRQTELTVGRRVTDARGAAAALGISSSWLRRLCVAGRIEGAYREGATWYIPLPVRRLPPSHPMRVVAPGAADRIEAAGVRFTQSRALLEAMEAGTPDEELKLRFRSSYPRRREIAEREMAIRKRNLKIMRATEKGEQRRDIAARHNISPARVTQIIKEMLEVIERLESTSPGDSGCLRCGA